MSEVSLTGWKAHMRKIVLSLVATSALACASVANAGIGIGTTATDPNSTFVVLPPDNVGIPETVAFKQSTDAMGSYTSFFDFTNTEAGFYNFLVGTSTLNSTITFGKLLSDGGVQVLQTAVGGGTNSISLLTGTLDANTTYRFSFNSNYPTGGGVTTGNASFYAATRPVPEPASWALMLLGFAGVGYAMRRRRRPTLAQVA